MSSAEAVKVVSSVVTYLPFESAFSVALPKPQSVIKNVSAESAAVRSAFNAPFSSGAQPLDIFSRHSGTKAHTVASVGEDDGTFAHFGPNALQRSDLIRMAAGIPISAYRIAERPDYGDPLYGIPVKGKQSDACS